MQGILPSFCICAVVLFIYLCTVTFGDPQAVLLNSGLPTAAGCVSAIHMVDAIPSPENAPAIPTAGVLFVRTPAGAPDTAAATRETAPVTRAGGTPPAPNPVSASVGDPWVLAVTS